MLKDERDISRDFSDIEAHLVEDLVATVLGLNPADLVLILTQLVAGSLIERILVNHIFFLVEEDDLELELVHFLYAKHDSLVLENHPVAHRFE